MTGVARYAEPQKLLLNRLPDQDPLPKVTLLRRRITLKLQQRTVR